MHREDDRVVEVLLVEDNAADVRLLSEALSEIGGRFRLNVVTNGEQAVDYVFRRGDFHLATRPDLILLDFNLPCKNGAEVLEEIKREPEFKHIPVVVLTSSRSEHDVMSAYAHGANCYLRKPTTLDQIYDLARTLTHHWFELAVLPSRDLITASQIQSCAV
ncbi:MAG TPA: response regulator [Bryobacteraceae bacterium]|nr:response regulator [Bryobacteraceae bacterium]